VHAYPAVLLVALALLLAAATGLAIGLRLILPDPSPVRPAGNGGVVFPMNGDAAVSRVGTGGLYLATPDHAPRRIIGSDSDGLAQACPVYSPDGALLAYGERHEDGTEASVVIVSVDGDATPSVVRRIAVEGTHSVPCAMWSPDGASLALHADTGAVWLAAVLEPVAPRLIADGASGLAWIHDGSALLVNHGDYVGVGVTGTRLEEIPIDGGEPRLISRPARDAIPPDPDVSNATEPYERYEEFFEAISASPTGPFVAVSGGVMGYDGNAGSEVSGFVRVLNTDSGAVVFEHALGISPFRVSSEGPAWSPDGSKIAWTELASVGGGEEVRSKLHVVEPETGALVARDLQWTLPNGSLVQGLSNPRWSPDGRRLAVLAHLQQPLAYAIASIAAQGPLDADVLTPWTIRLGSTSARDLAWQPID
jgi:dipeptidyl aminopeptidase/acylaminoacyl peptidase